MADLHCVQSGPSTLPYRFVQIHTSNLVLFSCTSRAPLVHFSCTSRARAIHHSATVTAGRVMKVFRVHIYPTKHITSISYPLPWCTSRPWVARTKWRLHMWVAIGSQPLLKYHFDHILWVYCWLYLVELLKMTNCIMFQQKISFPILYYLVPLYGELKPQHRYRKQNGFTSGRIWIT